MYDPCEVRLLMPELLFMPLKADMAGVCAQSGWRT